MLNTFRPPATPVMFTHIGWNKPARLVSSGDEAYTHFYFGITEDFLPWGAFGRSWSDEDVSLHDIVWDPELRDQIVLERPYFVHDFAAYDPGAPHLHMTRGMGDSLEILMPKIHNGQRCIPLVYRRRGLQPVKMYVTT
jgi:hypothetical protein